MAADPGACKAYADLNLRQKVVRWQGHHHYLGNLSVAIVWAGVATVVGFVAKKLHSKFAKKNMPVEDLGEDENLDEEVDVAVEETA